MCNPSFCCAQWWVLGTNLQCTWGNLPRLLLTSLLGVNFRYQSGSTYFCPDYEPQVCNTQTQALALFSFSLFIILLICLFALCVCAVVYGFKCGGIYMKIWVHIYVRGNQRSASNSLPQTLSILILGTFSCCNLGLTDLTRLPGLKVPGMPQLLPPSTSSQQHAQIFLWRLGVKLKSPCLLNKHFANWPISPGTVSCFFATPAKCRCHWKSIKFPILLSHTWSTHFLPWLSCPKAIAISSMLPRMETGKILQWKLWFAIILCCLCGDIYDVTYFKTTWGKGAFARKVLGLNLVLVSMWNKIRLLGSNFHLKWFTK